MEYRHTRELCKAAELHRISVILIYIHIHTHTHSETYIHNRHLEHKETQLYREQTCSMGRQRTNGLEPVKRVGNAKIWILNQSQLQLVFS